MPAWKEKKQKGGNAAVKAQAPGELAEVPQDFNEKIRFAHRVREEMMRAVEKGDQEQAGRLCEVIKYLLKQTDLGILTRAEGRLRSLKNIILSYNTLFSYSAEKGGMNSVTGHYKAERYAIMIERASDEEQVWRIYRDYCDEYADAAIRVGTGEGGTISQQTMDYIRWNFTNNLSIADLARELHLSQSYLMRRFKKETGRTIQQVITDRRINEACRLLANSNLNMTEISLMVGFNSSSYFSMIFRQMLGLTPKEYRNHVKGHYINKK